MQPMSACRLLNREQAPSHVQSLLRYVELLQDRSIAIDRNARPEELFNTPQPLR
jgi:hypothetical protein